MITVGKCYKSKYSNLPYFLVTKITKTDLGVGAVVVVWNLEPNGLESFMSVDTLHHPDYQKDFSEL